MAIVNIIGGVLIGIIFLACFIELLNPKWIEQKSRIQVLLGWFGSTALIIIIWAMALAIIPDTEDDTKEPNPIAKTQESDSSVVTIGAEDQDAFDRWCKYEAAYSKAREIVGEKIGLSVWDSLQPGARIVLKKQGVLLPTRRTETGEIEYASTAPPQTFHIPAGDHVTILDRNFAGSSRVYKALWVEKNAVGFINAINLMWLDYDESLQQQHAQKYKEALGSLLSPTRKRLFDDAGLDYKTINNRAMSKRWMVPCRRALKR